MSIIDPRPGYSHQHQCRATSDPESTVYEYGAPKPVYAGEMLELGCATRTAKLAGSAKALSPIEQAVELQRRASENVHELISTLEGRLASVLNPDYNRPYPEKEEAAHPSLLAAAIHSNTDITESAIRRLRDIIDGLTL